MNPELKVYLVGLAALAAAGCTKKEMVSRDADPSRQAAPIPACVQRLPATRTSSGMQASLKEPQYWNLVFPSYDPETMRLPEGALACNGYAVFQDSAFSGAAPIHEEVEVVEDGDVVYGGGGAQLKIVWFRTHKRSDGTVVGPIAVVRAKDGMAEVYAIGVHESRAEARLALQRLGYDAVVAAADEGCVNRPERTPCESTVTLYYPWRGELVESAKVALERVAYATDSEPGMSGEIEYHLVSTLEYGDRSIDVLEQITAIDSVGRELRRAEFEIKYQFRNGKLEPSGDSLWGSITPQVVSGGEGENEPGEADGETDDSGESRGTASEGAESALR